MPDAPPTTLPQHDLEEVLAAFPNARIDVDNLPYHAGLLDHRFLVNRCQECGLWHTPPRSVCPACWSTRVEPSDVTGRGSVFLLTRLYVGPAVEGLDYVRGVPFVVVELEEQPGLRVAGIAVGPSANSLDIGDAVTLAWITLEGHPHPAFQSTKGEEPL